MCKSPSIIRNPKAGIKGQKEFLPVPCGKCKKCVSLKIAEWTWRFEQELRVTHSPLFVTLTYRTDALTYNASGVKVLNPDDLRKYIMLLRFHHKKQSSSDLRFFACGEYGSKRKRPHYHVVLLNCDDLRLVIDTWKHGRVHVSPISSLASIGYTLKYLKKENNFRPQSYVKNIRPFESGFKPPAPRVRIPYRYHSEPAVKLQSARCFVRMSRGLGFNYISPQTIEYHNRRLDNYRVTLDNGNEIPLPKVFKDRIYDDFTRWKLGNFLSEYHDAENEKRILTVMNQTGNTRKNIEVAIDVEPYVERKKFIYESDEQ